MIRGILYRLRLPDLALLHIGSEVESSLGFGAAELMSEPGRFAAMIAPAARALLKRKIAGGGEITLDLLLRHKHDGSLRRFKSQAYVEADGNALAGVLLEVIEDETTGDHILELTENSPTPVLLLDRSGCILRMNGAARLLSDYSPAELARRPYWEFFVPPEQRQEAAARFRRVVAAGAPVTAERTIVTSRGHWRRFVWTICPLPNSQNLNSRFLISGMDLSELDQARDRIHFLSHYDALTHLPNEATLQQRFRCSMARADAGGSVAGIASVRFPQLKQLAATIGAGAHDRLVRAIAERLCSLIERGDACGRDACGRDASGDFLLLLERTSAEQLRADLERILQQLHQPFVLETGQLFLKAHAGVAVYPADSGDPAFLFAAAETSLLQAAARSLASPLPFSPELQRHMEEQLRIESGLRKALAQNAFHLHYQPQVDLHSGRIAGVEALIRWSSPEFGEVRADRFIAVAEESGLIGPIGDWALREACRQRRRWLDAGLDGFAVAVNVSAVQFADSDLPRRVEAALRDSGLEPRYLELELTEGASMASPNHSIEVMHRLKTIGVQLAIDDFGTGYSNLQYLQRFPLDRLKIDRAFIRDITRSPADLSLVRAMVELARTLGLQIVAEGVETEAQLALVYSTGCRRVQGYHFSRPLPAEAMTGLLRQEIELPAQMCETGKGERALLIVDDEPNIIASLRRSLRHRGYQVHTAADVQSAFEILARHEIGVILSDQRMPGMSGIDFLSRVKIMYPRCVRIVLSGYTDLQTITEAINQGAVYKFITKPWEPETLDRVLQEAFLHYERGEALRGP